MRRGGRNALRHSTIHSCLCVVPAVLFCDASEMDDDGASMNELIEIVRQYKVIYDTKSKKYKDQAIRTAVWEEIGQKLKQPRKLNHF